MFDTKSTRIFVWSRARVKKQSHQNPIGSNIHINLKRHPKLSVSPRKTTNRTDYATNAGKIVSYGVLSRKEIHGN